MTAPRQKPPKESDGVSDSDIKASYKDGILEIRVPAPEPATGTKIPVSKT